MRHCISINHRHFLLIGWIYYIGIPIILGYSGTFYTTASLSMMSSYFNNRDAYWPELMSYFLATPVFYLVGSYWASLRKTNARSGVVERYRGIGRILFAIYALMFVYFALQARALIGSGYVGDLDLSPVGPLATLELLILFQYLYERSAGNKIAIWFGAFLVINSLLLVSMGGRLYVLSAVISCYFRWWSWGATSKAAQLRSLIVLLGIPFVLVALGMWRIGDIDYSLVGFYLVAESVYTSISAFTIFYSGHWSSLLDIPTTFVMAFSNLIPSLIWTGKAEWLATLASANQNYESPFGGLSIIASTLGNFGFLGGLFFFAAVGAYMTSIGRTYGKASRQAYYSYLIGFLPFMFFRDPFQVQVKVVMTGWLLYQLTVLLNRQSRTLRPVSE